MTDARTTATMEARLDDATRQLVRAAAVIATGSEEEIRREIVASLDVVPAEWMEEVILQSYLFAGFPRTLNAAREWRKVSGRAAPMDDEGADPGRYPEWARRGEETCATVYGPMYNRLRVNIRKLHPALDSWMIVDGYGKVLGRPGLDLKRRELCVVAICAAARQGRQLHSHLHGALHSGATRSEVEETLAAIEDLLPPDEHERVFKLWAHVLGK